MNTPIRFYQNLDGYNFADSIGYVVHTLCLEGSMSFSINHTRYNVVTGDLVILLNGTFATDIQRSENFKAIVLIFSEPFYYEDFVKNNYTIVGHMGLIHDPVMHLQPTDFETCRYSLEHLKSRNKATEHLFHKELVGALLKAHVLELLNIHAHTFSIVPPESRPAIIMGNFIAMLESGTYIKNRSLDYYASALCITPHYLSNVSKTVSGQPASYWIDRFTIQEIIKYLNVPDITMSEIASKLNFSSISYLSRFIKKQTGQNPSTIMRTFSEKKKI